MAISIWPTTLPQTPLLRGFEWDPQNNEDTFQPSIGAPIIGPAMADAGDIFNVIFLLTDAQRLTWYTFWKTTVKGGSVSWLMPDWIGLLNYVEKIPPEEDESEGRVLVHKAPGTTPKITIIGADSIGALWELSLSLYRRPFIV